MTRRLLRHSLAFRLALTLLLGCVLCASVVGALLARSETRHLRDQLQLNVQQDTNHLATLLDQDFARRLSLARAANAVVTSNLFRTPLDAPPPLPPRQPDASLRSFDGESGAFIGPNHEADAKLALLWSRSAALWQTLAAPMRDSFFNFYLLTRIGFIRMAPEDWVHGVKSDHLVDAESFLKPVGPEQNPQRQPIWTAVYYDDFLQHWMTSLLLPVYHGERFFGATGADVVLDEVFELMLRQAADTALSTALLIDEQGRVIADSSQYQASAKPEQRFANTGQSPLLPAVQLDALRTQGRLDYRVAVGDEQFVASGRRIDTLGWHVVIARSEQPLRERGYAVQQQMTLLTVLMGVLLAGLLFLLIARLVLVPVRHLSESAQRIAAGDWDCPLPAEGPDEIGQLSHSFARMLGEVRRLIAGLRQEIAGKETAEAATRKLTHAIEQAGNGMLIADRDLNVEYVNARFTALTGISADDARGAKASDLLSLENSQLAALRDGRLGEVLQSEERWRHRNGEITWVLQTLSPLLDAKGQCTHFLISGEDITTLKRTQAEVERLAFHDPLTGLDNRHLFRNRLQQTLEHVRRYGGLSALLYVDLDLFKEVNDTLGHDAGDDLLREVARRLRQSVRRDDTCARLGGDEFALLLPQIADASDCARVAEHLLRQMATPFMLQERSISIGASIGITLIPGDGMDAVQLMKNADLALYKAKAAGRNGFQFFTPELQQQAVQRLLIDAQLREALAGDEFRLYWQPQIALGDGRVMGMEALLRWQRGNELIAPDRFLPVAEANGLIIDIGRWVLEAACRDLARLRGLGYHQLRGAINLSPRQLQDDQLITRCREALQRHQLPAQRLEIEITEHSVIQDFQQAVLKLRALRALGVGIAVDDFGIGHCSLSYLRQLPITTLKIDRSFVRDLPEDSSSAAIIAAVLAMANTLGLNVVAEGIEELSQHDYLRASGCAVGQGYYYGRPMPMEQLLNFLQRASRNNSALPIENE